MVKRIEIKTGTQDELQAALAAKDEQALAVPPARALGQLAADDEVGGIDAFTGDDMAMPVLTLVQPQHGDIPDADKHTGELYNDLTGEFSGSVSAVVLYGVKNRACFDREFSRDSVPLCASDDAQMPRPEFIGRTLQDSKLGISHTINESGCAACPLSRFGPDGTPPMCGMVFGYAMLDTKDMMPFVFRAQRTALAAAKRLVTSAKRWGRTKIATITTNKVTSAQGIYWVPVFTLNAQSPDVWPELKATVKQWAKDATRTKALPSGEPSFPDDPPDEEPPF